jgi:CO/xanthine dehydrogenase Mo-binding subunit
VADREWNAVRAQRALAVTWDAGRPIPSMASVYDAARAAPVVRADTVVDRGDPDAAIAAAAHQRSATYTYAVQSHATIGPSCALAQYEGGVLTVHSGSQAPFDLRGQIARMLALPTEQVRVVYHHSAGCFGRNGLEDAAAECAVLAMELAPRPVRLQWMRQDEMANEPKAPPTIMNVKGGVSAEGRMLGWSGEGWVPHSTLVLVQTTASAKLNAADGGMPGSGNWHANPPYDIPAAKALMHRVAETPFRPSWIRTPGRLQNCFAVESFTDELAAAAGQDPVAFRLAHMADPRARAVIEGAAQASGWDGRPSPRGGQGGDVRRGRGIAYIRYDNVRTYAAAVMAVEVDLRSGEIRVSDVWAAQDCGQVINPDGIRLQVEGQVVQTLSRTLSEEIQWEGNAITSLDWSTYRIMRFPDAPNVRTVIIDRPDQPMWGAGEMVTSVVSAAVGNAVFDATGVRLRHAPFTPERVKAALAAA